jgi:hypothetical protein
MPYLLHVERNTVLQLNSVFDLLVGRDYEESRRLKGRFFRTRNKSVYT